METPQPPIPKSGGVSTPQYPRIDAYGDEVSSFCSWYFCKVSVTSSLVTCFVCGISDGKSYHVKVTARHVIRFYLHDDWRSMIFEQVSDYEVNGVKGYGIFEFLYRSSYIYGLYYSRILFIDFADRCTE